MQHREIPVRRQTSILMIVRNDDITAKRKITLDTIIKLATLSPSKSNNLRAMLLLSLFWLVTPITLRCISTTCNYPPVCPRCPIISWLLIPENFVIYFVFEVRINITMCANISERTSLTNSSWLHRNKYCDVKLKQFLPCNTR